MVEKVRCTLVLYKGNQIPSPTPKRVECEVDCPSLAQKKALPDCFMEAKLFPSVRHAFQTIFNPTCNPVA